MSDHLLAYRDRFPILGRTNYLISNSLGAVPSTAREALNDYYETWAERGVRAWEEIWWGLTAEMGDLVAPLLGAGSGEVVFQPAVTLAHAVVLSALDFPEGRNRIVTDAMHFPSILYLLEGLKPQGVEIVIVPSEDGIAVDSGRVAEEIDERTAAVVVSHVLFRSAFIHDLRPITEQARRFGAISIVDGYQSVGIIPVDVRALSVDVYIGGCLKWLCGGPGNAFLWVRPELRESLSPRLTGWMAHTRPFRFEPTLHRRDDAWRFLHGTPNVSGLYAARPGLETIREVGIEAIRARSRQQTARLIELAATRGYSLNVPQDPDRRGGTVAVDVSHGLEVSRALKARDILCDYRAGAGIRLSPHFYNRDEELEEAIEAIDEILQSGRWTDFAVTGSSVT